MVERWFDFGRVAQVAFSRNAEGVRCLALTMSAAPEGQVRERAVMAGWVIDQSDNRVLRNYGTFGAQSEVVEALEAVFPKRDILAALKPVSSKMAPDEVAGGVATVVDPEDIAELVKAGGPEFQERVRGLVARFQLLHGIRMLKNKELPFHGDGLGVLNKLIDKAGLLEGAASFATTLNQVSRGQGREEMAQLTETAAGGRTDGNLPASYEIRERFAKILEVYSDASEDEKRRVLTGYVMTHYAGDLPYAVFDGRNQVGPIEASGAISVRGRGAMAAELLEDVRLRAEWSVRAIANVFGVEPRSLFGGNVVSIVVGPAVGAQGALGTALTTKGDGFRHGIVEITPVARGTLVHELAHQVEQLAPIDRTALPMRIDKLLEDMDRSQWERLEGLQQAGVITGKTYSYLADESELFARLVEASVGQQCVADRDRYGASAGGALGTRGGYIGTPKEALCLEWAKAVGPYLGSLLRELDHVPAVGG